MSDSPPLDESINIAASFPRLFPIDWGDAGQYEFRLVKPSEVQDSADLSIPSDAWAVIVTIQGPFGQRAYTYEVVATYAYDTLSDTQDSRQARVVLMPGGWRPTPPVSIVIRRRRVYCQGIAAYIEARGDPRMGETRIDIIGANYLPDKDVLRALKGRHLLRKIERRGRRRGPAGFDDDQDFENMLILLIREAHAKGMDPTEERIATLLQPALARRRRGTGSPASVDVHIASTARLIRNHLRCPWRDLVKKALRSP
jgi:hypothetical protein